MRPTACITDMVRIVNKLDTGIKHQSMFLVGFNFLPPSQWMVPGAPGAPGVHAARPVGLAAKGGREGVRILLQPMVELSALGTHRSQGPATLSSAQVLYINTGGSKDYPQTLLKCESLP